MSTSVQLQDIVLVRISDRGTKGGSKNDRTYAVSVNFIPDRSPVSNFGSALDKGLANL